MSATSPSHLSPSAPPRPKRWGLVAWVLVLVWAGVIFWLSSRSGKEIEKLNVFDLWDKAAHFLAFFGGALPAYFGVRWTLRTSPVVSAVLAAAFISSYGALDEYHQTYTPGRSGGDVGDWTADTLGAITGAALTAFLYARKHRPTAPPGSPRPAPAGD